eukprot:m.26680 g.26680  ORF g.26680 m.26680 type:complete len:1183 (+) comp7824_c0_seq1:150-3698(+)
MARIMPRVQCLRTSYIHTQRRWQMTATEPAKLAQVSLKDKYDIEYDGKVYLTGIQSLIRLPLIQKMMDRQAGLKTGGFICGYRGSPLAGYDTEIWKNEKTLNENDIHFMNGVNEDLAATAIWGTQQNGLYRDSEYDGVFGIWYGKGPGVDRTGDAFKHANMAGTSPHGGVLVLAGDDHLCKSSTLPHQSELSLMDCNIPVLNPANLQETIDFGLYGIAMSRYSGCWVSLKTTAEAMDSSANIHVNPSRLNIKEPDDKPAIAVHIRLTEESLLAQESRMPAKLEAVSNFWRVNKLDREVTNISPGKHRIGIATTGKSYLDVLEALAMLGLDSLDKISDAGISIYKVGMVWPLEPVNIKKWVESHGSPVIVVEEKRSLIEFQLKNILYNGTQTPVCGKMDFEDKEELFPYIGDLSPAYIASSLQKICPDIFAEHSHNAKVPCLKEPAMRRLPYFCAGCPHNTSTKIPEDSRAVAGIGCSYMSLWMDRNTFTWTHMGAEGVTWLGQAQFSKTKHVFANMGDGTYNHSGSLAIRQAVVSGYNITYKILYNDAIAMTGGQPNGGFSPVQIAQQLKAEGVGRVVIVSDDITKYASSPVESVHRDGLNAVQKELRDTPGVTAIIYEQTCAAEKRRRRKRGTFPDPPKRVFINSDVCEGCGDCGVQSNCVAVKPLETALGRKRVIDQSSCNKDYSCVKGFCPSFVTVLGGSVKKISKPSGTGDAMLALDKDLEEPVLPTPSEGQPWNTLICGIGGTGIVTTSAILGMAAHKSGMEVKVLDQVGLAQKGGAVVSHVRIAQPGTEVHTCGIGQGATDLLLACDGVTASDPKNLYRCAPERTNVVLNEETQLTGAFASNPDLQYPAADLESAIDEFSTSLAKAPMSMLSRTLLGDSIATNMFALGYAYQQGLVPVSQDAIFSAIDLNGVAANMNKEAFLWGRRTAAFPERVATMTSDLAPETDVEDDRKSFFNRASLDDIVKDRMRRLTEYQNESLAVKYKTAVEKVKAAEEPLQSERLSIAVAQYYFKLLAYKDEYEVGRLMSSPAFQKRLNSTFEGDYKLQFHLAAPLVATKNPDTGLPEKRTFGSWMMPVFGALSKFKFLRGTPLDLFGLQEERQIERGLIKDYEEFLDIITSEAALTDSTLDGAIELAELPNQIRGFGHVKQRNIESAQARREELLRVWFGKSDVADSI